MPINHPFKVKQSKDAMSHEFKIELPTSIENENLIAARFGTVERMIDRANAQLIVDIAPGIRKRLPNVETAQSYVDGYCDNGSRDAYVRPTISVEDAEERFDEGQQDWLREQGFIAPS